MAASLAPPPDGEPTRASSLTEWLRRRTDRDLARLLRLRPDLALPAAADLAALAARVAVRTSTQRAVDGLDAGVLAALEALVLAGNTIANPDVPPDALTALFDRALVWGEPDLVHLTPTVRDVIGPYPGGLGRPAAQLGGDAALFADPARLASVLDEVGTDERDVLDRLAAGPPVGALRDTRLPPGTTPDGPDLSAPQRLLARGLLVALDTQRVELPREVGRALRAARRPGGDAQPPQVRTVDRAPAELDRLGTTAVLETLRRIEALAESWSAHPPPLLRSGGLGVRELKRTARDLGVDETAAAVLVETAYAAGLVNSANGVEPVFLPTPEYDTWTGAEPARRWSALASAWLAMTRQPSLVSMRGDRDRVITALGPDAERGTIPALRRQVLDLLAGLPPGSAPADRADVLALHTWHQPRRATGQLPLVEAILAEADLLGVTAAGGLPGYTRTLLAGSTAAAGSIEFSAAAELVLAGALPEPVDHFLVQPDLTVVVPGPPDAALAAELALVADLESTGGASVYRITEKTVRRALDAGRSGAALAEFVSGNSRTPIPQALRYLIDDAARRHGVLRTGSAGAYLRCDDEALLTRVLTDPGTDGLTLRRIAPTVVVADVPVTRLLEVLRAAGFAPAAESPGGDLITLTADAPRAPSRPAARALRSRAGGDSDAQLADLVRRLRAGDALASSGHHVPSVARQLPGVTSAATMELLRTAVREAREVSLGVAEPDGRVALHTLQPISLAAGAVRGWEAGRAGLVSYAVHRITQIQLLEPDDDVDDPS